MKLVKIIAAVIVVVAAVGLGVWGSRNVEMFGTRVHSEGCQVITAISREEQVVLLSLSVQGIEETNAAQEFLGFTIPGSSRTSFLQYGFTAKLGIEGGDVGLVEMGDSAFQVTIPEFIFIGHSDPSFKVATEQGGLLSWITPDIDDVAIINDILASGAQDQYIADNRATLQDQAERFYSSIIHSIEPEAEITFVFEGSAEQAD